MQLPTNGIMCSFFFTVKLIIKLSTVYRGRAMNQGLATNKMAWYWHTFKKKRKNMKRKYTYSLCLHTERRKGMSVVMPSRE